MPKGIKRKHRNYWWLILLFFFDAFYTYFIQLVTSPESTRNTTAISIPWEGTLFLFFTSLISLYCVLLAKRLISKRPQRIAFKYLKILFLSLLIFSAIVASLMVSIEYLLGQQRDIYYVIGNAIIFTFHHFIISNAYTGYLYLKEYNELEQRLTITEKAKTELELKTLRQQMNPHFLFNNLNTLTSLIGPDQHEALDFTKSLSSIYRYFTSSIGDDLVALSDELDFIEHYFELMRHRFGSAYELKTHSPLTNPSEVLVVPMSLQVVIENVIKHNSGDRTKPLIVYLKVTEQEMLVKNEVRAKSLLPHESGSGTGLKNLNERCQLAIGRKLTYGIQGDNFIVKIPLIKRVSDENIDH